MDTLGQIIAIGGGGFGRNPKQNKIEKYILNQFTSVSGMHKEFSPMYSSVVLEDLLDIYNLNKINEFLDTKVDASNIHFHLLNYINKKTYTKLYLVIIAIHSFQLNLRRRIQL